MVEGPLLATDMVEINEYLQNEIWYRYGDAEAKLDDGIRCSGRGGEG